MKKIVTDVLGPKIMHKLQPHNIDKKKLFLKIPTNCT